MRNLVSWMQVQVSLNFNLNQKWETSKRKPGNTMCPSCNMLLLKKFNLLYFCSLWLWETPEVRSFRAEDPALLGLLLLESLPCKKPRGSRTSRPQPPCQHSGNLEGRSMGEMTLFQWQTFQSQWILLMLGFVGNVLKSS